MLMKHKWFLVLCLSAPFLLGCVYSGRIKNDFYPTHAQPNNQKLRKSIAICYGTSNFDSQFRHAITVGSMEKYSMQFGPAAEDALESVLRAHFDKVLRTQDKSKAQTDILAIPELSMNLLTQKGETYPVIRTKLTLRLIAVADNSLLAEMSAESSPCQVKTSHVIAPAAFFTGLLICIPAPVTVPLVMYCQGEKFKAQTEKSLRECLDGLDAQLSTNVSAIIRGQ
jgi:hypothetical protein